ncbi:PDDEXK nuclease domain-containing protein [Niabella beijingensis]|uniref:PDDEXK nuclease domain-containing protein n=1 Tax=Niabella beijingensis TaxID=2872700 RepID=UPI001CBD0B25|nr:PDDEXK nuclease domain-containing protein [Niabella beijingensis]MBZ4188092.1 PDDEXK nuclease domain-containing protein [Niabella beijingensis]
MSKTTRQLFQSVRTLILHAQQRVVRNVNTAMLITYFEIGRNIVEHELQGNPRAGYADQTIRKLSDDLTKEFGKGYSKSNLEYMRQFYSTYEKRIVQSLIGQSSQSGKTAAIAKRSSARSLKSSPPVPFSLSWTHYLQLLKINDEEERDFYEIEAVQNNWSVRELMRQYNASLYERLVLSRDKRTMKKLAKKGQIIEQPIDALKSHYVLEFLNLNENENYTESELEAAIINKLEHFMLELGKGFLFEGRQRRFTFEGDSFYVDLVFYNRLLKCFVLFDLKIGKLTHQDIGQMQMYVNYYDRKVKTRVEKPTIGVILCKEENKTVVEFTLPEKNRSIFAKEYKAVFPSKEALKRQVNGT